jgi:hypothetical protein
MQWQLTVHLALFISCLKSRHCFEIGTCSTSGMHNDRLRRLGSAAAAAAAGQYYVTGNLTSSLYDPNCTFKDPTTNVKGVTQHMMCLVASTLYLYMPACSLRMVKHALPEQQLLLAHLGTIHRQNCVQRCWQQP